MASTVPLKRISDQTGIPLGRLSKLALAGAFPSTRAGGRRRTVDHHIAQALTLILNAGIADPATIQTLLDDPETIAATATDVARALNQTTSQAC